MTNDVSVLFILDVISQEMFFEITDDSNNT